MGFSHQGSWAGLFWHLLRRRQISFNLRDRGVDWPFDDDDGPLCPDCGLPLLDILSPGRAANALRFWVGWSNLWGGVNHFSGCDLDGFVSGPKRFCFYDLGHLFVSLIGVVYHFL